MSAMLARRARQPAKIMRRLAFSERHGLGIPSRSGKKKPAASGASRMRHRSRAFMPARVAMALAATMALTAPMAGCLGYDGDFDRGYQLDESVVAQLKVGATTKPQALQLMGTPSTTSTVGGD